MSRITSREHPLVFAEGVLGFLGYTGEGVFSLKANGDNNFLHYGIAENSLLVIDSQKPFEQDKLNVFRTGKVSAERDQYKLSLSWLEHLTYAGQVIMSVMQYE